MRLRLASVEYKRCATENCGLKYEGAQCPKCRQAFNSHTTWKTTYDRLIVVGVDPPAYELAGEERFRCSNKECRNLYRESQCPLPLCGTARPQRSTRVWVRTFSFAQSLSELHDRELAETETEAEEVNPDE